MRLCTGCGRERGECETVIDPNPRGLGLHVLCDDCTRDVYDFIAANDPRRPRVVTKRLHTDATLTVMPSLEST